MREEPSLQIHQHGQKCASHTYPRTWRKRTVNFNKGFTIIELLVSVAIFSIIITGMMLAFMQQQRQFIFTQEAVNVDHVGRLALDFIATELRNAGARQAKNYSVRFINGGSPDCTGVTSIPESANSPPDCIEIYTWDKTLGFSLDVSGNEDFPSVPGDVTLISSNPIQVIIPDRWVEKSLISSADSSLIGFWSRVVLCDPTGSINCSDNPIRCTECGAILKFNENLSTGTVLAFDQNSVIEQNFQDTPFDPNPSDFSNFTNNFFIPRISSLSSEMTIVKYRQFSVDTDDFTLKMSTDPTVAPSTIAGGTESPGIVDMQFVFNLQDTDGNTTKVGVPNGTGLTPIDFTDFTDPSLVGSQGTGPHISRIKDTNTVQIYLVVRSRLKPILISGSVTPAKNLPQIGDRLTISTGDPSLGEGYIYKIFTTTVYLRNIARDEVG